MNILIAGQKWFGAEVFRALRALPGVSIKAVCAPTGGDKLAGQANLYGVPVIASGTLNAASMPAGIDLIVAAHSHDFIGQATRLRAKWGGIGYHPSLLPLHRAPGIQARSPPSHNRSRASHIKRIKSLRSRHHLDRLLASG